jgi:PAS domain S-box-containing protein
VEQALEEAERRATGILECIADGFLLLDAEWRILQINPAAERILGAHAASMAGRNLWEEFPLAVGTQFESNLRQAMAEKTAAHFENCYRPWDRWFDVSAYPLPEGLAIYFRDITERKRNETALIRLNEDLKQFTFAATHDLREPLRAISAYAQLLQQRVAPQLGDEGKLFVSHLYGGAQRVTRLIEGLLQFTRLGEPDESKPSRVDAWEAMRDAVNNLHLAIAEAGAKIESEPLPPVLGNFAHVCQLFQNLVANGIKYRKPGVVPQIRIRAERTGQLWVFAVEDNGIGISPEDGERIFVPFKRLHGAEIAGAGIGLATCKRIVTRYGGNIWVKSVPEQGSTFYFSLPSAD